MDWFVDALRQSQADEQRSREDAIARLQQTKIQNRLDKLYDDRLDGFIEPAFFERKARDWRQTQRRFADQIGEYLTAVFRQPFDLLALTNRAWQKERPPELIPATFGISWQRIRDSNP